MNKKITIQFRVWDKKGKKFKYFTMISEDGYADKFYEVVNDNLVEIPQIKITEYATYKDRYEIQFKTDVDNVYDGDIVRVKDSEIGEFIGKVVYFYMENESEIAVYKWIERKDPMDICFVELSEELDEVEIIGNIFENPELLKEDWFYESRFKSV